MSVRCFMITPAGRAWRSLRRYHSSEGTKCPGEMSYHNAHTPLDLVPEEIGPDRTIRRTPGEEDWPRDDPRWPTQCAGCDYLFTPADPFQVFCDSIYVDAAGVEYSLRTAPPGAMWDAWWMGDWMRGPDGKSLIVICPNDCQWAIDGPASNCTMPNDRGPFDQAHRCWVRHGEPPNITIDKGGRSCAAGAGSIQAGDYHGFLRNGEFT